MNDGLDPGREREPIVFRITSTPAGWRILGVDSLTISTLYLSEAAALVQARSMADVMIAHGQPAEVVVEGGAATD